MDEEFPIDKILDAPLSFSELGKRFRVNGRKAHCAMLARLALKGVLADGRRIKLPSINFRGRRYSSVEAFRWFVEQATAARSSNRYLLQSRSRTMQGGGDPSSHAKMWRAAPTYAMDDTKLHLEPRWAKPVDHGSWERFEKAMVEFKAMSPDRQDEWLQKAGRYRPSLATLVAGRR